MTDFTDTKVDAPKAGPEPVSDSRLEAVAGGYVFASGETNDRLPAPDTNSARPGAWRERKPPVPTAHS